MPSWPRSPAGWDRNPHGIPMHLQANVMASAQSDADSAPPRGGLAMCSHPMSHPTLPNTGQVDGASCWDRGSWAQGPSHPHCPG